MRLFQSRSIDIFEQKPSKTIEQTVAEAYGVDISTGQHVMDELKQSSGVSLTQEEIEWAYENGAKDPQEVLDLVNAHRTQTASE